VEKKRRGNVKGEGTLNSIAATEFGSGGLNGTGFRDLDINSRDIETDGMKGGESGCRDGGLKSQ